MMSLFWWSAFDKPKSKIISQLQAIGAARSKTIKSLRIYQRHRKARQTTELRFDQSPRPFFNLSGHPGANDF